MGNISNHNSVPFIVDQISLPLITIGVPVYNGAATLAVALESLATQKYQNLQIIISDNASTDGTLTICEDLARRDSRVRIIRKPFNEGAVANFRTVLDAAEGEYFMWAAADDCWHPDFVSRLLPSLENDSHVGVAMCAIDLRRPDAKPFRLLRFVGTNDPNGLGYWRLFFKFYSGIKYNLFIYGLFRTTLLKRAMPGFPEVTGGDRQFMSHLALACRFAYVDEVLHIRTYQPKNEQGYWIEMAQTGILRCQIASFAKLVWCSPIIPWWRKIVLLPVLPRFVLFNFRQTPMGRQIKFFTKKMSAMMNIKKYFYISNRAAITLVLFFIFVVIGVSALLTLKLVPVDILVMVDTFGLLLLPCLALLIRRWVIQSQKTLQQALADNHQEHSNRLAKSHDHLMKELRYFTVGAVSSVREKIQMLQPEDILSLSSLLTLKVKLDYDKEDIFLQVSSLTEYPRRLACHKEPMTVRWIEQHVNEGDVFYDIGSNVGAYGLLAAKVKKATVIAFEPAFFNYVSACRNVLINGCHDKISVFPFAISSKTQADYFNYADLNTGSANHSLGEPINYRNEHFVAMYRQPVIAYALDDLISQFDFPVPSHLKIDVDGTEMDLLMGAQKTLENPLLRTIMIEISERRTPASAIAAYLSPKGWSLAERYDRPVKPGQSDVSYLLFVR